METGFSQNAQGCQIVYEVPYNNLPIKNSKTTNTPETISSTIFGSAAILQTLSVKYELQWALRHYNLVIGECPLAGFKTVKDKPAF
jgi:hypothetical protein